MALTMEQQAALYRSKSAEEKAALQARKELTQRVIAAGGVPTQARLDAITTKTAATRAAAAKEAAAAAPKVPDDMVRNIGEPVIGKTVADPNIAADRAAAAQEARELRKANPNRNDQPGVQPRSYRAGNLPPGRGELDAEGNPLPRSTRPFRQGGRRSNRRRGRKMPLPPGAGTTT